MFDLVIGEMKVDQYVDAFSVNAAPAGDDNEFRNYDGSTVRSDTGDIITLNISLKRVPTNISKQLSSALSGNDVEVSFTSPMAVSETFRKIRYSADCRAKGLEWNIDITLESAAPVGGSRL